MRVMRDPCWRTCSLARSSISSTRPRLMYHMAAPAILRYPQHESIAPMDIARKRRLKGESYALFKQLLLFNRNMATNPLDKIYGLFGIANDCGPSDLDIPVNYRLTKSEMV